MQGISGFIDYDHDGNPYMGMIIETETTQYKFYFANKAGSFDAVRILHDELSKLARELRGTPRKIVAIEGGALNGLLKP